MNVTKPKKENKNVAQVGPGKPRTPEWMQPAPRPFFFGGRNIDPPHTKRFRYQKVRSNKVSFPHQWDAEEDGVDFFNFLFLKKGRKKGLVCIRDLSVEGK
jgi:hypothetical protein